MMSDTSTDNEPMDVDSSNTEWTGNTKNVTGDEHNFNHPSDEKRNQSKELKSSILQNNLSETPLTPDLAEHEDTADVDESESSLLATDRMQIEVTASAIPPDNPVATVSVIQDNNRSVDTPNCCNVSTEKSNCVKDANGILKQSYADVLDHRSSSNHLQHPSPSFDTISGPSAQTNDSNPTMKSSAFATAEHLNKPVIQSRLNITIHQPNPSQKAIANVVQATGLQPALSSAKKTYAPTIHRSNEKIEIPTTSAGDHNLDPRPNLIANPKQNVANGKGDFVGVRVSGSTSHADDGRESDTHQSSLLNQPSGSEDSKWQNRNCNNFSVTSDSKSSNIDTEDDDFSDIEDLISGLKEFERFKWVPSSTSHRLLVGRHGSWYDGDFDGNCMSGFGCLFSHDKRQFVQGSWTENKLVDLQSFQFIDQGAGEGTIYLRKQANSYLLTFDEDEFVARAQLRSRIYVDFTSSFRDIKLAFFRNLTITNVINDRIQSSRQSALYEFERALKHVLYETNNSVDFASALITLRKFFKTTSRSILAELSTNSSLPSILCKAAADLLKAENMLSNRRLELLKFSQDSQPPKLNVVSIVQSVYAEAVRHHRQRLVDKCLSVLPKLMESINEVIPEKIIYVSRSDIEVFHHMASLTRDHDVFLEYLHRGLFEKLDKFDSSCPPNDIMPLTTPVCGFLFKSFLEICSEICLLSQQCNIETLLTQSDGKWKLLNEIPWDRDIKQSRRLLSTQESLDCQYRFIFKLLLHFEPKNYHRGKQFRYDFKVLVSDDPVDDNWYLKQFKKFKDRIIGKNNFANVPEDRQVWLYILDHTIHEVLFNNKSNSKSSLALMKPMLDGHVTFLSSCPTNSYESFRMMTHNILLFIIQTYPYIEDSEKLVDEDLEILEKQMKYISYLATSMKNDASAAGDFRDLVNEYNRYWRLHHLITLDESNCPDYLISKIKRVHELLLHMVDTALGKTVQVTSLVNYLRELNDFMEDLKDIDFPSIWYVKSDVDLAGMIEKIDNKLASESKCSYKVTDLKGFTERFKSGSPPQHYIIQVVQKLLECASESLSKSWISSCEQPEAQLEGTGALLGAMRSSFLYLKEQPDYRDFELFCDESIQPFIRVLNGCNDLKEFKTRVNIVKESFWYIRKMDEIGVVKALQLFNRINNGSLDAEKLEKCYNTYLEKYNEYISDASAVTGVDNIVQSMNNERKDFEEFTKWGDDFKLVRIPEILAGLSAVWSLLVSKDVSSTGKFLKPHCIQILCIMRLLSVDNSKPGVEHHLAQVLTGQGKSVILGLLSAFLAFTGYNVSVVCYSSYLAKRDKADFEDFYSVINVDDNITYENFDDMYRRLFMSPKIDGQIINLGNLVKSLVLEHRSWEPLGLSTSGVKKTILLIDEVDVFFSENVYGSSYQTGTTIVIPALTQIQEKIWSMVDGGNYGPQALYDSIAAFIDEQIKSGQEEFSKYNEFRLKRGSFSVLVDESGNLIAREFTNRSLLETHVKEMVDWAIIVSRNLISGNDCKIIDGKLYGKDPINGDFKYYLGYGVIFTYFKLKQADFAHMNFENYGYIDLTVGSISYAKLPEEFPLILGVSGTLSDLRNHESEAIKSYKIQSLSLLPSYFGDSNLKFNQVDNFCIVKSLDDWGSKIFERINAAIDAQRSALVFFDTESILTDFKNEFANKFDRLNVLTENTDWDLKAKYIDEAGIASTVTLATRMMGRGVDFKSSMSVEKKGGVHVIQTFFSLDVKEETQIKGRTARKDNKGSYELILCEEHLIRKRLLKANDQSARSYDSLNQTRLELSNIEGAKNAEKIQKCEKDHNTTMQYYGLHKTE
ncbi:hypothetical protein GE061_019767 [Apolygus lucorum]|uniref:SecA family profile domain-containing protein n=1 Tax=Apolygus lucorum TaxID=248454 RepID=A0A8S9XAP0_APOLU|nr:hypothetical protein GE061_019767 [Apolygus lucorum]